jgi:uncharacterized protein (DUF302 family)
MTEGIEYGYSAEVAEGYDEAVVRARLALKSEGFSIITESHVGGLFGPEAGSERQYLFMGAWDSTVGRRNVGAEIDVAVHLPCNVVVQETGTSAIVAALAPLRDRRADVDRAAEQAREALARVLSKVQGGV